LALLSFYQPAVQLHKELSVRLADVMGGVVAHEIGHLLLGSHAHASTGIMRAQWRGEDLHKLVKGELLFTAEQAAQMRTTVARNQQTLETQLELNQGSY
jgi:predicted SprT family Zn-dependent metalloprotease